MSTINYNKSDGYEPKVFILNYQSAGLYAGIESDGMRSEIVADGDVEEVAANVAAQVDFIGTRFDD